MTVNIRFLYYEDCPSYPLALEQLHQVLAEEHVEASITIVKVETEDDAHRLHFTGSPTILIHGQDIDPPPPDAPSVLTCRAYHLEDGRISPLPSPTMIRNALRKATTPMINIRSLE